MKAATILALDVGAQRIGVALARAGAGLPRPLLTLANDASVEARLRQLIKEHEVAIIVVGLPRGMEGQETAQTAYSRQFAEQVGKLGLPVYLQDEAGTSLQAKEELISKGKPFDKSAVDALAATYILEDFMANNGAETEAVKGDV